MKKFIMYTLAFAIAISGWIPSIVHAEGEQREISVLVDELPLTFEVQPVNSGGTVLVPFRAIAEAIGVRVEWDGATQTIKAANEKASVKLQIGSSTGYCNEKTIKLAAAPVKLNGRTLIPIRFFSEAFDCKVVWDSTAAAIKITSPKRKMWVTGFYALGDKETSSWKGLFGKDYPETGERNTGMITSVALGWYSLDGQGGLLTRSTTGWQRPEGWEKVLEAVKKYKLKTEMVVHMTDMGNVITNLIADKDAVNRAVKSISEEAKLYDSVDLDMEGLGLTDKGEQLTAVRENFSAFVKLLSEKLKAQGCGLSLSLHPLNSDYKGYDYRELGKYADRIIIMAYDYGPKPEPADKVIQAVELAKAQVSPQKLVLGISAPNETPESVRVKMGIAKRYGLKGIALWRLGLITDELAGMIKEAIEAEK